MKRNSIIRIVLLLCCMQAVSAYKIRCWILCSEQTAIQNDYVEHRDYCRNYSQLRIDTDTSNPQLLDPKERKAKLVSLFSACMADKGWTVPDGRYSQQPSAPIPAGSSAVMSEKSNPLQTSPLGAPVMQQQASAHANGSLASGTLMNRNQYSPNAPRLPAVAGIPVAAAPALAQGKNAATLAAEQRDKAFLARSTECAFARHSAENSSLAATRAKACDIECAERLKAAPDAPRPAACPADPSTIN